MAPFFVHLLHSQWFVTPRLPNESFDGKTVIVTGGNSGLGREAARHIVRLGATKVIIAGRNVRALEEAREDIMNTTSCAPSIIETWELDLCSYESVITFAKRAKTHLSRLDVLLENAGISTTKFRLAERDESTITTNVVSTFLLGLLLLPKMKDTAIKYKTKPHLTIVTSEVHHFTTAASERKAFSEGRHGTLLETMSDRNTTNMNERYEVSKLLEVFVVREIVRISALSGHPVIINLVNPGFCASSLSREASQFFIAIIRVIMHARSSEVGSRTLVHAASAGAATHGEYLSDCRVSPVADFVASEEGKEMQGRVWKELAVRLDSIAPGLVEDSLRQ